MNKLEKLIISSFISSISFISAADIIQVPFEFTVRDFRMGHPDFDNKGISGLQLGLVENSLADGVPVFTGTGEEVNGLGHKASGDIYNATTFSSWFSDCNNLTPELTCIDEYNVGVLASLDIDTGVVSYINNSFFPLDSLTNASIWDSAGGSNDHNYFFTAHLSLDLEYNASNGNDFSFKGDDDVWVFINDELVMDLGGIHGAVTGDFDMDDIAIDQGINEGDIYSFDFFFAERHHTQSNIMVTSALGKPITVPEPATLGIFSLALMCLSGLKYRAVEYLTILGRLRITSKMRAHN